MIKGRKMVRCALNISELGQQRRLAFSFSKAVIEPLMCLWRVLLADFCTEEK